MNKVRIISNKVVTSGGTLFEGDEFVGTEEAMANMVAAGSAEWVGVKAAASSPEELTEEEPAESAAPSFASGVAADLAEGEDLTAADFEGVKPSGKGGFTKADVEKAAGRRGED